MNLFNFYGNILPSPKPQYLPESRANRAGVCLQRGILQRETGLEVRHFNAQPRC